MCIGRAPARGSEPHAPCRESGRHALLQMFPARMAGGGPERETPERERSGTEALRRATEAPERKVVEDLEKEMRRFRTRMLVRHARAVDAIFEAQEMGGRATPEQVKEHQ